MNNYRNSRRRFGPRKFNQSNSRGNRFKRGRVLDESLFIKNPGKEESKPEYKAKNSFDDFKINPTLRKNVLKKGFSTPTPIQDQSIPDLLKGSDLVGIANTGTGKTVAFLLPSIEKVIVNKKNKVLIIAPTRELANQINDELYSLTRDLNIFSVLCTGGASLYKQISNIKRGFNFIVGTPGRLKDLSDRGVLNYSFFNTVVLDEVDRMLDMGFIKDIREIVSKLPKERQSIFFSATMDVKVEKIMNEILKPGFKKVSVKTGNTSENIKQDIVRVQNINDRLEKLEELLRSKELKKTLIFVDTKRGVEKLYKTLHSKGYRTDSIHGDRRQRERQRAIDAFKADKTDILVATDVAARGLDISMVTHVINYDTPTNYEDYVHRIGRTGRANNTGSALTFIYPTR